MPAGNAFVAKTDRTWFEFLRSTGPHQEVNFWRPSLDAFSAVPQYGPLIFEIKGSQRQIGGFGYFLRYERLPIWLAWECFGGRNGAASLPAFLDDLGRNASGGGKTESDEIGCLMLLEPVFFNDDEFITLPDTWPRHQQRGKKLDLERDPLGRRVWRECLDRAMARRAKTPAGESVEQPRYAEAQLYRPRLGQGTFRIMVSNAYRWSCAVTREHSRPVLEAAHIRPYAKEGEHEISNGLLLRSDIHRLFDRGYVTVTPDHVFRVSDKLRKDYSNGKSYYPLAGKTIVLPPETTDRPSPERLEWHSSVVFKE